MFVARSGLRVVCLKKTFTTPDYWLIHRTRDYWLIHRKRLIRPDMTKKLLTEKFNLDAKIINISKITGSISFRTVYVH